MTEPLRLQAADPVVLDITRKALDTAPNEPGLRVLCKACGSVLARAAATPHGPLFHSKWQVPADTVVELDGREATSHRTAVRALQQSGFHVEDLGEDDSDDGLFAVIVLPEGVTADYPPLLVRCKRHGDTVLDRLEVVQWLRDGGERSVRVDRPNHLYIAPTWEELAWRRQSTASRSNGPVITMRIRSAPPVE